MNADVMSQTVLVAFPNELLPVVLVAILGEYDDAIMPVRLAWADHDEIDTGVLATLRACHEHIVALGNLIAQLTWARPTTTSVPSETAPHLEAAATLLERVFNRAISDTILLVSTVADDRPDPIRTDQFHRFASTLKTLTVTIENLREAAAQAADEEALRADLASIRNPFAGGAS